MPRQLNGRKKTVFSTNGARTTGIYMQKNESESHKAINPKCIKNQFLTLTHETLRRKLRHKFS
jgi:hypothetical protein